MWKPNGVFTSSEVWPGCMLKTTSSNAGTMRPGGKQPRSPPLWAEPWSSEDFFARAAKSAPPLTCSSSPCAIFCASASGCPSPVSPERTFTRMWLAQASSSWRNSSRWSW